MKRNIALLTTLLLAPLSELRAADQAPPAREPVRLILETDMSGDCDDAGALALLYALADRGECTLLAVLTNRKDESNASAAAPVNGEFPQNTVPEVNIMTHKEAAQIVVAEWPGEIVWHGFEVGEKGSRPAAAAPVTDRIAPQITTQDPPGDLIPPYPPSTFIESLTIDAHRVSIGDGDNWANTWGDDDRMYSFFTDGRGFDRKKSVSCAPVIIEGPPPQISGHDLVSPTGTIPDPSFPGHEQSVREVEVVGHR